MRRGKYRGKVHEEIETTDFLRRVWDRAGKEEEEGPRRLAGYRLAHEVLGLACHPFRVVRALCRLLVAAPHGDSLLKTAVLAHDLMQTGMWPFSTQAFRHLKPCTDIYGCMNTRTIVVYA